MDPNLDDAFEAGLHNDCVRENGQPYPPGPGPGPGDEHADAPRGHRDGLENDTLLGTEEDATGPVTIFDAP